MMLNRNSTSNKSSNWMMYLVFIAIIALVIYGAREKILNNLKSYFMEDKSEIEKVVSEYIQNHPKEILESLQKMQEREYDEMAKKAQAAIKEKKEELTGSKSEIAPFAGNMNGEPVIVTFLDYRCGYCKTVNNVLKEIIKKDPQVKVMFKELPVLGPQSQEIAQMALAVYLNNPSKYIDFHNQVMDLKKVDAASLDEILIKNGLDVSKVKDLMKDPRVEKELKENMELAKQLGIRGTPAFIVGETLIPGAVDLETMQEIIKDYRKNNKK